MASSQDKTERRQAPRFGIFIPAICREFIGEQLSDKVFHAVIRDLSLNGVRFKSKAIYPIGTRFQADIYLPSLKVPISPTLRVQRVDSTVEGDQYMIGAKFETIGEEEKKGVEACLESLDLYRILEEAQKLGASDIHLTVGHPAVFRKHGGLNFMKSDPIEEGQIKAMLYPLLNDLQIETFEGTKELDFAFSPTLEARYRVNLHVQKGFTEASMRNIPPNVADFKKLGMPEAQLQAFCKEKAGLVLISGKTGAGKTTTLTAMIDYINRNLERVVITVEDPIEYIHTSQKSIVKQRELGSDTKSYGQALRHSLRQDPDVIVVSELLDGDAVLAAMRAAETGHLVLSTIHAPDTAQTIERILNLFPPEHGNSIRQQLSSCLVGILFQTLLPSKKGGQVAGTELLINSSAIRTSIREGRFSQIGFSIQTGASIGMYTLESNLRRLLMDGIISEETLKENVNPLK